MMATEATLAPVDASSEPKLVSAPPQSHPALPVESAEGRRLELGRRRTQWSCGRRPRRQRCRKVPTSPPPNSNQHPCLITMANLRKQTNDSGAHDGPNRAKLNGSPAAFDDLENKHITGVEEAISADVSVSGGSDTEASRARDGEKGHGRTSSTVKKPATFKAVSVNKTFLAAKGAAAAAAGSTASKPADKSSASLLSSSPSGTSTLSSRPRLIAKSGSGTGNAPRLSAANGTNASGPDPSAVWNKNRRKAVGKSWRLWSLLIFIPSCSASGAQEIHR